MGNYSNELAQAEIVARVFIHSARNARPSNGEQQQQQNNLIFSFVPAMVPSQMCVQTNVQFAFRQ